ncbi:hypothetical protein Tco_0799275 [Tanacetum coccineum]
MLQKMLNLSTKVINCGLKTLCYDRKFHVLSNLKRLDCAVPISHKVLSEMLEDFDRQDVMDLHRLVKERYSASRPEGYDLMTLEILNHFILTPNEEDEIWKNQHEYNVISCSLCDFCGIHILLMQNGIAIHMLTEKKYPLSQEMIFKDVE